MEKGVFFTICFLIGIIGEDGSLWLLKKEGLK